MTKQEAKQVIKDFMIDFYGTKSLYGQLNTETKINIYVEKRFKD